MPKTVQPMERRRLEVGHPADQEGVHQQVRDDFAAYAATLPARRRVRSEYDRELRRRCAFYVERGASVLELGVGTGDLLASLGASRAVGVDLSEEMLAIARQRHPELELHHVPAETLDAIEGPFDYVILSDLVVHLYDVQAVLEGVRRLCHDRTRIIVSTYSRLWQPVLVAASWAGLAFRHRLTNWVSPDDAGNLLEISGFEVIKRDRGTLLPLAVPLLAQVANRLLHRLPLVRHLCLVNWIVARPVPTPDQKPASVTVVCPVRNEEGNVPDIVRRCPQMGAGTELIFVEGGSTDQTRAAIEREIAGQPGFPVKLLQQPGAGKGDAVRAGFAAASGEILMILDADLTVPPEDLPKFYDLLQSGRAEFVNGSRLVYPMEQGAMRFLNILGNKCFSYAFSYLLDQRLKDTLCGTKVLRRIDYERLARQRSYFGEFDPFGDYDLLFGASKLGLRIVDLPIRYGERVYGETNISRFRHGWRLLRMCGVAFRRLKLI